MFFVDFFKKWGEDKGLGVKGKELRIGKNSFGITLPSPSTFALHPPPFTFPLPFISKYLPLRSQ